MRHLLGRACILLLACAGTVPQSMGSDSIDNDSHPGLALFVDRQAGNCLACHRLADRRGGNLGPPLNGLRQRYPNWQSLYDQIADARQRNPNTIMPPFGAHGILTAVQLRAITDYLYGQ